MSWVLYLKPLGETDIENARKWYETKHQGLGDRFLDEISRAIRIIEQDADRFALYYRGTRRIQLSRFPYKIFYILKGDKLIILRVLHAKQEHRYRLSP